MTRIPHTKHGDSLAVYLPSARGGLLVLVPTDPLRLKKKNGQCAAMELPTAKRTQAPSAAKGGRKTNRSKFFMDDEGPVEWKLLPGLASEGLLVRYGADTNHVQLIHVESRSVATVSLPDSVRIGSLELTSGDTWVLRTTADEHGITRQFFLRWSGTDGASWKETFKKATREKNDRARDRAFEATLHLMHVDRDDGMMSVMSGGGGADAASPASAEPSSFTVATDARGYMSPYAIPPHLAADPSARCLAHPNSHLQVAVGLPSATQHAGGFDWLKSAGAGSSGGGGESVQIFSTPRLAESTSDFLNGSAEVDDEYGEDGLGGGVSEGFRADGDDIQVETLSMEAATSGLNSKERRSILSNRKLSLSGQVVTGYHVAPQQDLIPSGGSSDRAAAPSTYHSSLTPLFLPSFLPSFMHSTLCSVLPSFIHPFLPLFLFLYSVLPSCIPSFKHSLFCFILFSFIHSFHSFLPSFLHAFRPLFL
jgi:hypothetical protein